MRCCDRCRSALRQAAGSRSSPFIPARIGASRRRSRPVSAQVFTRPWRRTSSDRRRKRRLRTGGPRRRSCGGPFAPEAVLRTALWTLYEFRYFFYVTALAVLVGWVLGALYRRRL